MPHFPALAVRLLSIFALAFVLPSCTIRVTTKETTDTTSNVTGTTSGKSWVSRDGLVNHDRKVEMFAHVNFDNLMQDLASGQGEYLTSFGTLLGIPDDQRGDFLAFMQAHASSLLVSHDMTSNVFAYSPRDVFQAQR